MAGNYICVGSSQHKIRSGSFTLRYLRRTPEQNYADAPSWEMFMREDVLRMTTKLVRRGCKNPNASMTISADSVLNNGLSIELHITGIEVSEDNIKNYINRMEQYLKEMALNMAMQTLMGEASREQRQSQVSEIQSETPREIFGCRVEQFSETVFGEVAIVPNGISLREDNSIIRLYEGSGRIPSALRPGILLPLCNVPAPISIFVPECSIRSYLIPWRRLTTHTVYLMVATPYLPGTVTGLLPFLCESDGPSYSEHISRKLRINPPLVNQGPLFHNQDFGQLEAVLRREQHEN